ncbi:hypothetical protein FRC09_015371, partial [Ceratobasidium sp. 395]
MSTAPPPGIYVPAVLFFTPDEELDFPSIKTHLLRLAQAGVTGVLVLGMIKSVRKGHVIHPR